MSFSLSIRQEAEAEIAEAYRYYEQTREGLGADFILCVEEALSRVIRNPEQFRKVYKNVARAFLHRFPYGVFFVVEGDRVVVIAFMHARRQPFKWQTRIS